MNSRNTHIRRLSYQRSAAVAVWVAVSIPVIAGFTAVGIDLSRLHSAKNELQRAADAAALAAAGALTGADGEYLDAVVLDVAQDIADRNVVIEGSVELAPEDVVLGRASYNHETGRWTWEGGTDTTPNGVQVTLRRTEGSPSGPVPTYFGRVVGKGHVDLSATARAAIAPRAIAIVVDDGQDMNDDSELIHEAALPIMNLQQVWQDLGSPTFGNMVDWNTLVYWNGNPNQLLENLGLDDLPYPEGLGGSWSNWTTFVKNRTLPGYRKQYGLKTFIDYINNEESSYNHSPLLADTRQQPLYTEKQIVNRFVDYLESLGGADQAALCSFNSSIHYEVPMTSNYSLIRDRMNSMISGYVGDTQNVGSGVGQGRQAFTQGQVDIRSGNRIIVLISDGRGRNEGENYESRTEQAVADGMTVYTISVGYAARPGTEAHSVMQWIGDNGGGYHLNIPPTLDIGPYEEELDELIRKIRGRSHPAVLIG